MKPTDNRMKRTNKTMNPSNKAMKPETLFRLFALLTLATATLLAGCNNESDNTVAPTPVVARFTSTIAAMQTRVAGTAWEAGDRIGIYAIDRDPIAPVGQLLNNAPYITTQGDGVFTPDGGDAFYFKPGQGVYFHAYYPYRPDATGGVLSFATDSEMQKPENQPQYDILCAETTANFRKPDVQLQFSHVMSRIVLNFQPGQGIASLADIDCTISGLFLQGQVDLINGRASYTSVTPEDITLSVPYADAGMSSPLILFPQVNSNYIILKLTMRGTDYTATFFLPRNENGVPELQPGYSYSYNVIVNNKSMTVSEATINPWGDGGSEDITSDN